MKNLLPLLASAIVLAGCAADDAANPWITEQERADARVAQAAAPVAPRPAAEVTPAATSGKKYSWQEKAANAPKPEAAPVAIPEGKAIVTALRSDAGLIQIKIAHAPAPGDKLVLNKEGKSLLVVVNLVEGDSVIADIASRQLNTPSISVGDEVICTPYEGPVAK